MTTIKELASGTGYKRRNGALYLKEKDDTHSRFEVDPKCGAWIVDRESETFDPNESVTPISTDRRSSGLTTQKLAVAARQQTLTAPILLAHIGQTWIEHHSLLLSMQQQWVVSDLDLTILLMELRISKEIMRERRPAGRRMSFHYKRFA